MWEKAIIDENIANNPDFVKAYTVAIPNLPLIPNKEVKKFIKWINKLDGLCGIRPEYPYGTLIIFKTENDAKIARNKIKSYPGYDGQVGKNISEIYIPKEYVR